MEKIQISVVVITKNEENNISDCLRSAAWANEIIVLDDYSSDNTVNIARQFTDKVSLRRMDIEGVHRNYAYSLARNNWVLSLDADERVSEGLREELRELFKKPFKDKAFTIPIKTYMAGRWIRYGGWYPAPKVRLFDRRFFRYEEAEVHPRVFIQGGCGHLKSDIIHYSYRDFHDFFASLNNQTTLEARKWFKERRKIGFVKLYRKFVDRFLKSYILKQGFRDGFLGFMISYASGLYQVMSYAKYWQMLVTENREQRTENR
jgi:glycosyltransferase involved in cell wall biosynthesis